jgi:ankyrin repeat protein
MWPDMPVDLFKEILDKSDDANAQDDKGDTPLHWALQNQSTGAAHQLLHLESVDVI